MKKIVFTLGAITAICACGLVIDPDKLVEGNGATESTPDGSDGSSSTDGLADTGAADAASDGPTFVEVPECVPAPPSGTKGPYAVTFEILPSTATCPAGYLAAPITKAKGSLHAADFVCGNADGCACGAPVGTAACNMKLRYFADSQCKFNTGEDTLSANCLDIDSENYLKVTTTVTGITCSSSGPAKIAPTFKPTPTYQEDWVVCEPDPNVKLAQCKAGEVAVPPAKDAGACVITTAETCPAPYTEDIGLSKSGTFEDSRACACSCDVSPTTCTGGSATLYSEGNCSDPGNAFALDSCLPRNGDDGMKALLPFPSPACTAKVTPDGSYTPSNDLHLCCLP